MKNKLHSNRWSWDDCLAMIFISIHHNGILSSWLLDFNMLDYWELHPIIHNQKTRVSTGKGKSLVGCSHAVNLQALNPSNCKQIGHCMFDHNSYLSGENEASTRLELHRACWSKYLVRVRSWWRPTWLSWIFTRFACQSLMPAYLAALEDQTLQVEVCVRIKVEETNSFRIRDEGGSCLLHRLHYTVTT